MTLALVEFVKSDFFSKGTGLVAVSNVFFHVAVSSLTTVVYSLGFNGSSSCAVRTLFFSNEP